MTVELLTAYHLAFLSSKEDCTDLIESTLVKMSHCGKSHVTAQLIYVLFRRRVDVVG